jgi:predicted PurR-regulated permease PerM
MGGVILGVSLAVVALPLQKRLSRAVPAPAAALVITLGLLAMAALAALLSLTFIMGNTGVVGNIWATITGWVEGFGNGSLPYGIPLDQDQIAAIFSPILSSFSQSWKALLSPATFPWSETAVFFLAVAVSLWKGESLYHLVLQRMPEEWRGRAGQLSPVAADTLYAIFVVHGLMVAVTFAISLPFFYILGYGHVLFFSFATALCELVPVLGSSIPMVVLGLYVLALSDMRGLLLIFGIGYLGVAVAPEIAIRPVLMGRRVCIHPVLMFFGFLGGIVLLGMAGFVLGPLFLALAGTWLRLRRGEAVVCDQRWDLLPQGEKGGPGP